MANPSPRGRRPSAGFNAAAHQSTGGTYRVTSVASYSDLTRRKLLYRTVPVRRFFAECDVDLDCATPQQLRAAFEAERMAGHALALEPGRPRRDHLRIQCKAGVIAWCGAVRVPLIRGFPESGRLRVPVRNEFDRDAVLDSVKPVYDATLRRTNSVKKALAAAQMVIDEQFGLIRFDSRGNPEPVRPQSAHLVQGGGPGSGRRR